MTTRYEKELAKIVAGLYGHLPAEEIVTELCRIGVVDHTLCKVLAVRRRVEELVGEGNGKVDSMWMAAEQFCVSYEYVRKCVYYYTDVNLP